MKKNITIIDYGSGNILSAKQSFAKVKKTENVNDNTGIILLRLLKALDY